jgi:dTDP-4-dehydrorhamnose 3,5-epimerase-like enzyme
MNAIGTKLKDVYLITTETFDDHRGSFTESFNLGEVQKIIGEATDFLKNKWK